jgi:transposase
MTTLLPPNVKVHLGLGYIDMRKGIDGLPLICAARAFSSA